MGKCKRRTISRKNSSYDFNMKREDVVSQIVEKVRKDNFDDMTKKMISLFGITEEELLEAGACFEDALLLKKYML